MSVNVVEPTRKTGDEPFTNNGEPINANISDFWRWAYSDLLNNIHRGKLAEFIVASALCVADGISGTWEKYDITFRGIRIEVKSAAYLQSWHQENLSAISFDIRPTLGWDATTGKYDTMQKRQADVYVMCLLKHKDKKTVDPLNLEQWEFYVVETAMLNELLAAQKRVSLGFLKKRIAPCDYGDIRNFVGKVCGGERNVVLSL
ncbi:MAG: hypothetical protein FWD57_16615 [Polyangiaceae bacterium]|nr:hypothetical protein [Polyangiaceae bacterium]